MCSFKNEDLFMNWLQDPSLVNQRRAPEVYKFVTKSKDFRIIASNQVHGKIISFA